MLPINQVLLGDAIEVMKSLPDNSVDAVITDPPYAIGVADWDVAIDIAEFTIEVKRVCKGFYAFFGQMPTLLDWMLAAKAERLHYCEHITWVKRHVTSSHRLSRGHEDIFIYGTGKLRKFYQSKGRYEDVKLPGVLVDVVTLEGIDSHIKDLRIKAQGKSVSRVKQSSVTGQIEFKRFNNIPSDRSPELCNYSNVWSFLPPTNSAGRSSGQSGIHPTEKPIEVMKRLVEMCSPVGGVVLDPFLGSGTTAIACLETGRDFIGIEKNEGYYQVALDRVAQHQDLEVNEYPTLKLVAPESQKTQGWKQIKLFG